jgi:hypothetical protein
MLVRALAFAGIVAIGGCTYPGTEDLPGDEESFDVIAAVPQVRSFVGAGARLIKLEARHVRSSGTQDLTAKYFDMFSAATTYEFLRPTTATDDPSIPVGARTKRDPFTRVVVEVMRPHWLSVSRNGRSRTTEKHRGMSQREFGSATPTEVAPVPACSFAKLWAVARTKGASPRAVATITYDRSGYTFVIPSTTVKLNFDHACRLKP